MHDIEIQNLVQWCKKPHIFVSIVKQVIPIKLQKNTKMDTYTLLYKISDFFCSNDKKSAPENWQ